MQDKILREKQMYTDYQLHTLLTHRSVVWEVNSRIHVIVSVNGINHVIRIENASYHISIKLEGGKRKPVRKLVSMWYRCKVEHSLSS